MKGRFSDSPVLLRLLLALLLSFALHYAAAGLVWQPPPLVAQTSGGVPVAIMAFRIQAVSEPVEVVEREVAESEPFVREVVKPTPVEPEKLAAKMPEPIVEVVPPEQPEPEPESISEPVADSSAQEIETLAVVEDTPTATEQPGLDQLPTMTEPRYRKASPPRYPKRARRKGQEGVVMVRAKVADDGVVLAVELLATSGHNILDMRALATVQQWEFYPHHMAGLATESWVDVPVQFSLNGR